MEVVAYVKCIVNHINFLNFSTDLVVALPQGRGDAGALQFDAR